MSAVADSLRCCAELFGLDEEQRAAVAHGKAGEAAPALLLIAGAGSGKTTTLAARVARLVLDGADAQRMLLLSFSRRAAQELQRRVGTALHRALGLPPAQAPPQLPWAGTFHSVAARLLREYAPRIGLAADFSVLDRGDAEDLLGLQRQALGLGDRRARFPLKATCLAIHSRCVNSGEALGEVLRAQFPWCAAHEAELRLLFQSYTAEKLRQHLLDFDDLLLWWAQLMAEPLLAASVGSRFDHVLVDEYQDTNRLQARIVRALKPDGRGVTAVGDDAQSIYSFRAAEVRNILDFPAQYPQPARVLGLTRNYRSTQPILDAANALMAQAAEGYAKRLWTDRASSLLPELVHVADEAAQAAHVADEVLRQRERGMRLRQQAVLFRASQHSAALELELSRRGIPFVKFGGLRFIDTAHVKDLLSLLRWAGNPRHRLAAFRVAQLLPGIGPAQARRLIDALQTAADPVHALREFRPPAAAREDWDALLALWLRLHAPAPWPAPIELACSWYEAQLPRLHDDAPARAADLRQLAHIAGSYGNAERFLTELTLDPPELGSDLAGPAQRDEDYLILSTMHSAKGQEWKAVYLLNAVDGCIPSDLACDDTRQLDEERRLLYVAMTRAREHLEVLVPQRFFVTQQARYGDAHVYALPSRFLDASVRARMHERTVPAPRHVDTHSLPPDASTVDLASRVASRWDG
ncbi:MAG: ATP-dependent helicase [Betaproteobacteria bacterium]|nr:ATP-dependent helicase [Betaproteobacteria bacterium]